MRIWEFLPDYILRRQGIKLLHNGESILLSSKKAEAISKKLEVLMKVRLPYVIFNPYQIEKKERQIIRIKSYDDLRKIGLHIISLGKTEKWRKGQKVEYRLLYESELPKNAYVKSQIPSGHHVEFDTINKQYRLIGKNVRGFKGEWKSTT